MAKISSSAKNGLPTHHHPVHSAEYIEVLTAMGEGRYAYPGRQADSSSLLILKIRRG